MPDPIFISHCGAVTCSTAIVQLLDRLNQHASEITELQKFRREAGELRFQLTRSQEELMRLQKAVTFDDGKMRSDLEAQLEKTRMARAYWENQYVNAGEQTRKVESERNELISENANLKRELSSEVENTREARGKAERAASLLSRPAYTSVVKLEADLVSMTESRNQWEKYADRQKVLLSDRDAEISRLKEGLISTFQPIPTGPVSDVARPSGTFGVYDPANEKPKTYGPSAQTPIPGCPCPMCNVPKPEWAEFPFTDPRRPVKRITDLEERTSKLEQTVSGLTGKR